MPLRPEDILAIGRQEGLSDELLDGYLRTLPPDVGGPALSLLHAQAAPPAPAPAKATSAPPGKAPARTKVPAPASPPSVEERIAARGRSGGGAAAPPLPPSAPGPVLRLPTQDIVAGRRVVPVAARSAGAVVHTDTLVSPTGAPPADLTDPAQARAYLLTTALPNGKRLDPAQVRSLDDATAVSKAYGLKGAIDNRAKQGTGTK